MRIKNLTPFPFSFRVTSRRPPQPEMTAIVRGRLTIRHGAPLAAPEGPPLVAQTEQGPLTADVFREEDDEGAGECLYPSDFADFKLNAEVMLRGTCHTPDQRPLPECPVRFAVGGWSKILRVIGPRVWTDSLVGRPFSDPIPFTRMPLGYTSSFGGPGYPLNPVGKGVGTEELPSVELAGEVVRARSDRLPPAGFGPLNPAWPQRSGKWGKRYGKEYAGRAPFYAEDLDWTFFHAAPADQQLQGYLRGDEELVFQNLHPAIQVLSTRLPGLRVRVFVMDADKALREVKMNLDTLFADLDAETVTLTWRGLTPVKEIDISDVRWALVDSEPLTDAPLPEEHYQRKMAELIADPYGIREAVPEPMRAMAEAAVYRKEPQAPPGADAFEDRLASFDPAERERLRGAIAKLMAMPLPDGADMKSHIEKTLDKAIAARGRARPPSKSPAADTGIKLKGLDRLPSDPRLAPVMPKPAVEPGPGQDLSDQDLSGRDLRGADLRGANLSRATLRSANLAGARLAGAILQQAILERADLSGADLSGADLSRALAVEVRAAGADLRGATLDHALLDRADLSDADLREARGELLVVIHADLTGVRANGASLSRAFLQRVKAERADFTGADLAWCRFEECDLRLARLDGAALTKASFNHSDLRQASLVGAKGETSAWIGATLEDADLGFTVLVNAQLREARAARARFHGANLKEASFYRAVLDHADLTSANLAGAVLMYARLTGTKFTRSNLFLANFTGAAGAGCDFTGANLTRCSLERS